MEQAAVFRIEALDKASAVLNRVEKKLGAVAKSTVSAGKTMTGALTAPLGLIGVQATSTFADFELSMAKVQAVSGATGKVFEALEGDAKRLGAATQFSASQVSGLQLEFSKLGFKPDEILKATEATLALAQATDEDLGASAAVAGGTLRGFRLDASETGRVTDVMAKSFSSSALDLEKFAESMKFVAPVAAETNTSIEETTALLSVLADNQVSGSQAGTALRTIFNKLSKDGKPVAEVLKKLGDEGLSLAEAERLVGKNAQTALLILANNAEKIKDLSKEYDNAAGIAKKMADIMGATLTGAFKKLGSAAEAALIAVGAALTPVLTPILEEVTKLVGMVSEVPPSFVAIGVAVAGVAAAIGPALIVFGSLISAVSTVAGVLSTITAAAAGVSFAPVIAAVAGVAVSVGLLVKSMGGWEAAIAHVREIGVGLGKKLSAVWSQLKEAGVAAWDLISGSVTRLLTPVNLILGLVGLKLPNSLTVLGKVWGTVLDIVEVQLLVITKALQTIAFTANLIEVAFLTMAKVGISAFNDWADANQDTLEGFVGFANGVIAIIEGKVNAILSTLSDLIVKTMKNLSDRIEPFINGIIEKMNALTGTDFAPINLKVEGLDDLKVDLGRVSIEGLNEGREKIENSLDSLLGDAKSRLGSSFGELIGQGGGGNAAAKETQLVVQSLERPAEELSTAARDSGSRTQQAFRTAAEEMKTNAEANGRFAEATVRSMQSFNSRIKAHEKAIETFGQMQRDAAVPKT